MAGLSYQPIDARDITDLLVSVRSRTAGRALDVGGPDVLTYGEMIERIAELMLLLAGRSGWWVPPRSPAAFAAAIAEEDPDLVVPLMESLRGRPAAGATTGPRELLGVRLHSFDAAVEHALSEWERRAAGGTLSDRRSVGGPGYG